MIDARGALTSAFGHTDGGPTAAGAYRGQLVAALERQEAALAAVVGRLHSATSLLRDAELDWTGTARRLFDIGLAALVSALAVAIPSVEEALTETRRAIATLVAGG